MADSPVTEHTDLSEDFNVVDVPASPLLQLPNDVRYIIFRYALVANHDIEWPTEHSSHHLASALLRTCKELYHEAAPILYRYNRFTFSHPSDCNIFRWIMDKNYSSQMSNVAFKIRDRDSPIWAAYHLSTDAIRSLKADLPNLQSLEISLRQHGWHFLNNPDEAFKLWDKNQRLMNVCSSLKHVNANVTVFCIMEISEHHFEHLKSTQAPYLVVYDGYALKTKAVEMYNTMAVLELRSPKASYAGRSRVIGV